MPTGITTLKEFMLQNSIEMFYVNDDPEASTFSRYVVGQFQCCDNKKLSIDPMDAANRFLSEPMGRNFRQLLVDIETEMCDLGCSKCADG